MSFQMKRDVLIVEDDNIHLHIICRILQSHDLTYDVAHEGFEALTCAADVTNPYGVILMDQEMDGLSGSVVTRMLRKRGYWSVIAGHTGGDKDDEILDAGADFVFHKPVDVQSMIEFIRHEPQLRNHKHTIERLNSLKFWLSPYHLDLIAIDIASSKMSHILGVHRIWRKKYRRWFLKYKKSLFVGNSTVPPETSTFQLNIISLLTIPCSNYLELRLMVHHIIRFLKCSTRHTINEQLRDTFNRLILPIIDVIGPPGEDITN